MSMSGFPSEKVKPPRELRKNDPMYNGVNDAHLKLQFVFLTASFNSYDFGPNWIAGRQVDSMHLVDLLWRDHVHAGAARYAYA